MIVVESCNYRASAILTLGGPWLSHLIGRPTSVSEHLAFDLSGKQNLAFCLEKLAFPENCDLLLLASHSVHKVGMGETTAVL